MWWIAIRLCVLIVVVRSQTTEVNQCTQNQAPLPINTYIEGCITPRCDLVSQQDAVINIIFRAPHTIRKMETVASAYLFSYEVEYDLRENANTCVFLRNTYCPVLADEVTQYTLRMYMDPMFPVGIITTIEFRVVDDIKVPILCIRVPIRIVAPRSRANATHVTDISNNSTNFD